MIDRSNYLPLWAVTVKDNKTGYGGVFCYSLLPVNGTFNALWPGKIKNYDIDKDPGAKTIIWDYFKMPARGANIMFQQKVMPELHARQKENYEQNKSIINPHAHTRYQTVVICGAGPSLETDLEIIEKNRDKFCVVTINSAHVRITGDYFLTSESLNLDTHSSVGLPLGALDDSKYINTIAHISTITHPVMVNKPWKQLTFFSHGFDYENGAKVPLYYVGRHSTFDALQFATTILKAKKVIFTGMDYIYQNGKKGVVDSCSLSIIEAASLIASVNGVDVWNASRRTAFKNGVKLGSFEEALRSPIRPRGVKRRTK